MAGLADRLRRRLAKVAGVEAGMGLSESEIEAAERAYGFTFPPDLADLLRGVLPLGEPTREPREGVIYAAWEFPNWREPTSSILAERMSGPWQGIAFDIEHQGFWWEPWGERPATPMAALATARRGFADAPVLVQLVGHRYMAAVPDTGTPVFSVHQTDVLPIHDDLVAWVDQPDTFAESMDGHVRVPFWTALCEWSQFGHLDDWEPTELGQRGIISPWQGE